MHKQQLLRRIPAVDSLLTPATLARFPNFSRPQIRAVIRAYLHELRTSILQDRAPRITLRELQHDAILAAIAQRLAQQRQPSFCRVINATGVVLHTGLGRAVLPTAVLDALAQQARGYVLVEVQRQSGKRGQRDMLLARLLCELTGAAAATVVNNNAAATMLTLAALAQGREVLVSRGQLVEIGGSFRMPDVMAQSGCRLVEVGCTNRTHLEDYRRAITPQTAAIMVVHTSNYKITGFTHQPALHELVQLAHEHDLLLLDDIGSGAMIDLSPWGLGGEPLVSARLQAGVDVLTFSGDKLLGACQAGIILGQSDLIARIRRHPLARVVRVDKLTLIALETVLKLYQDPQLILERLPTYRMLLQDPDVLQEQAHTLATLISKTLPEAQVTVKQEWSQPGSGALPTCLLPTWVVALKISGYTAAQLSERLRMHWPPIFSRVQQESVLFDPRTLQKGEAQEIAQAVADLFTSSNAINED